VLVKDVEGDFFGQETDSISYNEDVADSDFCTENPIYNSHQCENVKYAILAFESLSRDSRTRLISPVTVTGEDDFENILNSYKGYKLDPKSVATYRLNRFNSLVKVSG